MDKTVLIPIGLLVVFGIILTIFVISVQSRQEYWNQRFEERKAVGLAVDKANLNEIKSISECNNMFVSIMKHDNEWWEESNRQQAWDFYKENCLW